MKKIFKKITFHDNFRNTIFHGFSIALFPVCSPQTNQNENNKLYHFILKIVKVTRELTEPVTTIVSRSRKEDF